MNVLIKFLSDEPIENVVTCLNYKLDRVVYFGQFEGISRQSSALENFLKTYCNVTSVAFRVVANYAFDSIKNEIKKGIGFELENDGKCYYDITGGEALMVHAFGDVAKEYGAPVHVYNVKGRKLIEINEGAEREISSDLPVQKVRYDISKLIKLHGGAVNFSLHKDINDNPLGGSRSADLDAIWEISSRCGELWNAISEVFRNIMEPDEDMKVECASEHLQNGLDRIGGKIRTTEHFMELAELFAEYGIILDLQQTDGIISFRFKSRDVKEYLWMGGSALELHVYRNERKVSDDCMVGVHLDWDGELHYQLGLDVLNEIDVLSLNGYIPKFISCKSGSMGSKQTLRALYEIDTVARRFGGKYARKVLVTAEELGPIYRDRAEEMGIELVVESN